jgi:tetratricopeptide (TPR) repeat protein
MRKTVTLVMLLAAAAALAVAQEGPADRLWDLYQQGRFEDVIREGKVELTTGTPTAQVNLAVGRALVDLQKNQEGLIYLETAARLDPGQTWVYAWAQVYLGLAHFRQDRPDQARIAWIKARDCGATRNATRTAASNLKTLGLDEYFDDWESFTTEHFEFRYSPGLQDFDGVGYARRHEEAYTVISTWFGGGPLERIQFFVWRDKEEATAAGMPPLGFSRPEFHLVHARADQPVGHEMTHVISAHALQPEVVVGLINEGTAVFHDQTGRDQLALAWQALADAAEGQVQVSVAALWEDWSLLPEEISYPLAGAWVSVLITRGGQDKFLKFFRDQSLAHARGVYGPDLQDWLDEFDGELYR